MNLSVQSVHAKHEYKREREREHKAERFTKAQRVRSRAHYKRVQSMGTHVHTRHFLMMLLPGGSMSGPRLGVTVTKKIGNAVERNRVKRLVREVFRRNSVWFPERCDVVFIAKRRAHLLGYEDVKNEVKKTRRAMHNALENALTAPTKDGAA